MILFDSHLHSTKKKYSVETAATHLKLNRKLFVVYMARLGVKSRKINSILPRIPPIKYVLLTWSNKTLVLAAYTIAPARFIYWFSCTVEVCGFFEFIFLRWFIPTYHLVITLNKLLLKLGSSVPLAQNMPLLLPYPEQQMFYLTDYMQLQIPKDASHQTLVV